MSGGASFFLRQNGKKWSLAADLQRLFSKQKSKLDNLFKMVFYGLVSIPL